MSQRLLICSEIQCPYWSNNHKKSYGCQRWKTSEFCHLKHSHKELESNEYALYADAGVSIQGLKNENEAFFLEDPQYQSDLEFQQEFPDWGKEFPSREIGRGFVSKTS